MKEQQLGGARSCRGTTHAPDDHIGPLGTEGLAGGLTWQLEPADGGTRVTQTYVVGGNMRFDRATIAPAVEGVLREQLTRLAALFSAR